MKKNIYADETAQLVAASFGEATLEGWGPSAGLGIEEPQRQGSSRRRQIAMALVASVVVLGVVGAIAAKSLAASADANSTGTNTSTIANGTVKVLVSGSGIVMSTKTTNVYPAVSGTVSAVYVSLGDRVAAGDKLFAVSSSDAKSAVRQANTALLQAKQSKRQADASLSQAKQQLYQAEASLLQAEQALSAAQSGKTTASAGTSGTTGTTGTSGTTSVSVAKKQVASAQQGVYAAENNVSAAQTGVSVASANVTSARSDYDEAVANAKKSAVTAATAGVVTTLSISKGAYVTASSTSSGGSSSSAGGQGSSAAASSSSSSSSSSGSTPALVISDYSKLKVQVSVSEVDIDKVKVGQKAIVSYDASSSATTTGTVTWISPNASSSNNVVTYGVDITPDKQSSSIRPGMTASADVLTRVAEDVVVVPNSAIKLSGTTKYVEVMTTDGTTSKVNITTGVGDDSVMEVTSGLKVGDVVVNGSTSTSTSSGTSSSNGSALMMGGTGGPPSGGPPSGGGN